MKVKIVVLSSCLLLFLNAQSQSTPLPSNDIDLLCAHIDSLSSSKSFERFYFDLNRPNVALGYRIHYVDTANKRYKKIIFKNDIDTLVKTFYFMKDTLIEIKIEKNAARTQAAKFQFEADAISYQWDPGMLVKDVTRLLPEGKRYYRLVRYSKSTF
ncbi:MAG: hypothetical protein ABIN36_05190 [Ferruginibacter sp.]